MDLLSRPGRRRRRWKPGVVPQSSDLAPLQGHSLVLLLLLVLLCQASLSSAATPISPPRQPNRTIPPQPNTHGQQLSANPARLRPRAAHHVPTRAPSHPHLPRGMPRALWRREEPAPEGAPPIVEPSSSDTSAVDGTTAWSSVYSAAMAAMTASKASPDEVAGIKDLADVPGVLKLAGDSQDTSVVRSSTTYDANNVAVSYVGYNAKEEPVTTAPIPPDSPITPSTYTTITMEGNPPVEIVYGLDAAGQTVTSSTSTLVATTPADTTVVRFITASEGNPSITTVYGLNSAGSTVTTSTLLPAEATPEDTTVVSSSTMYANNIAVSYVGYNTKEEPITTAPIPPDSPITPFTYTTTIDGTPIVTVTQVAGVREDGPGAPNLLELAHLTPEDTTAITSTVVTEGDPPATVVYGLNVASSTVTTSTLLPAGVTPEDTSVSRSSTTYDANGKPLSYIGYNAKGEPVTTAALEPATAVTTIYTTTSIDGNSSVPVEYGLDSAGSTVTTSTLLPAEVTPEDTSVSKSSTTYDANGKPVSYIGYNAKGEAVTTAALEPATAVTTIYTTTSIDGNPSVPVEYGLDSAGSTVTTSTLLPSAEPADGIDPVGAVSTQSTITVDGKAVSVVQFNREGIPIITNPLSPPSEVPKVVATSTITGDGNTVFIIGYGSAMEPLTTFTLKSAEEPVTTIPVTTPENNAIAEGASPTSAVVTRTESTVLDGRTVVQVYEVDGKGSTVVISTLTPIIGGPENSKSTTVNPPVTTDQKPNDNGASPTETPASPPEVTTLTPITQGNRLEGLDNPLQASPPGSETRVESPTLTPVPDVPTTLLPSIPLADLKTDTAKETTPEAPRNTSPEPSKTTSTSNPYAWVPTSTLLQNPSATEASSEQPASTETKVTIPPGEDAKLANEPKSSEESQASASSTADAKAALPSEWPSSIVPQQDADALEDGDQSEAVGLVGARTAKRPADTSVISILFTKALSWSWLLSQGDASGQVFAYMPVLIATSLGLDPSEIVTISLEAWKPAKWTGDGADVRSVWVGHMPSKKVDFLAALMVNTSSDLYTTSKPITKQLASCIDPSLPLLTLQNSLGIDPSGASPADQPDENAGKMSNKTTAFVASAAALGAIVLAVGAFFGSRYAIKKRKIAAEDSLHGSRYSGSDASFSSPPRHHDIPGFSSAAAPMDNCPLSAPMNENNNDYPRDSEYYGTQSDYPVTERDSMRDTYASLPPTGPLPPPPEAYRQSTNSETIAPLGRNGASSYYPTERSYRTTLRSGSGSSVQSEILGPRQASMEIPIRDTWWKHASQWNDAGGHADAGRGCSVMSDPAPKSGRIVTLERPFSASTYSTLRTADGGGFNSANPFSQAAPFGRRWPSTKPSKISAPYLQDNSLML